VLTESETTNILRLPKAARRRAFQLQAAADGSFEAARERTRRSNEIREEIRRGEVWLSTALAGPNRYSEDDGAIVGARAKIDLLKAELSEIASSGEAASAGHESIARLAQRVRDAIALPVGKTFRPCERQPAVLRKGEDAATAVRRCRGRLAELKAKAAEVEAAPYPASFAKEQAAAQITRLAEEGRPDVNQAIQHGGTVEFAKDVQWLKGVTDQAGYMEAPNAQGVLAWVLRDKLIEAVHAEIDRHADDESALHPDERKSLLSKIAAQIEALEFDEVSYIDAAKRDGLTIDHRPDVGIPAFLWLDPNPVAVPAKPATAYASHGMAAPKTVAAPIHAASLMPEPALRGSI
jgi:hypothetical protein